MAFLESCKSVAAAVGEISPGSWLDRNLPVICGDTAPYVAIGLILAVPVWWMYRRRAPAVAFFHRMPAAWKVLIGSAATSGPGFPHCRIVPETGQCWWIASKKDGGKTAQVAFRGVITNLGPNAMLVVDSRLVSYRDIDGNVAVKQDDGEFFGRYPVPEGWVTRISANWLSVPVTPKPGETLRIDIEFTDNFGQKHLARNVRFRNG